MNSISLKYINHQKRIPPALTRARLSSNELTILISGEMTYRILDTEYKMTSSDAIFIPNGTLRERPVGTECDYISFNFTSDEPNLPYYMKGACHSEIMLLISAIDKMLAKPHIGRGEVEAVVGVIISILEDYEKAERMTTITRDILSYLHEHFRERITLDDIGKITFFSPVYCETVFRREIGRAIIDYIIELRISEAEKLILENAYPLGEISRAVGFEDYNYFSRTFKKRTGYSPTEYRRRARG